MAGFRHFVIGCVLSAASIMMPAAGSQAMPVPGTGAAQQTDVQTVSHRPGHGHYRPHHRPGYRPGRPYYGYRPYYRPYYRPGFNVYINPPVYRDRYIRRSYGSAHVNWCLSRYRSYNPATNRFLSYGGVYKVCYSPYR